jgi:hypothetical protein
MPVLNLQGMDQRLQLLNITSVMCYPSKKYIEKRRSWLLRSLLGIAGEEYLEMIKITPDNKKKASRFLGRWLSDAIFNLGGWHQLAYYSVGPGQKKSPAKEVEDTLHQGRITGWMLLNILLDGGGVSTCAERLCSDEAVAQFKEREEIHPNQDINNIMDKIWPRYKAAAHLWAAFVANKNKAPSNLHRFLPMEQFEPGGLKGFLDLAEGYKQLGEQYMPPRGPRKPLLDKNTNWQINL